MRHERFNKMNVVPFIDIVLVLLVMVLATASFVTHQSIKVDIPTLSESNLSTEQKEIEITIDKKGEYYYNQEVFTLASIKQKLLSLEPKKDMITLKMDKASAFKYFVSIIDILKTKGFQNISIITKK